MGDQEERRERGLRVRRAVLGDDHVDAAIASATDLDAPFQDYLIGSAWADVWGRPGLEASTRSLVTIALLAALGHERELELHLRATQRTRATPEQIVEVLLQVGVYAGVPAANRAFSLLKRVLGDRPSAGERESETGS